MALPSATTAPATVVGLLALLFPLLAWSAEYSGKVVAISDGDTLRVLYRDGQLKVRLAEIDTPEKDQPYSSRAKQALSDLCFGKTARVVERERDRYGRIVGRVYCDGIDANAEMIRRGAAWVYRRYAKDKSLYRLEEEAKEAKRGLWGLPEAQRVPPWRWRQARREGEEGQAEFQTQPAAPAQPVFKQPSVKESMDPPGFRCGAKRYCNEMATCAEARFYLEQCGLTSLDGDKDGVPCESLCR